MALVLSYKPRNTHLVNKLPMLLAYRVSQRVIAVWGLPLRYSSSCLEGVFSEVRRIKRRAREEPGISQPGPL
jgi:hypothetical protein